MINILLLLTLLFCGHAIAQEENIYKTYCDQSKIIFQSLEKEYGEQAIIAGQAPEDKIGIMTLWVNPITKTWTLLLTYPEKTCVIGGGKEFTILGKSKSNK